MKKILFIAFAAALSLISVSSCQKSGFDWYEDQIVTTESGNWTIKYLGTEKNSGGKLEYILKVSASDSSPYYLDVIAKSDFRETYESSYRKFIEKAASDFRDSGDNAYYGNKEVRFSDLDGGEWVAVAYGLDRRNYPTGQYKSIVFTVEATVQFTEYPAWSPSYDGRGEVNGETVEKFSVKSTDKTTRYRFVTVSDYDYTDYYKGDVASLIQDEFNALKDIVADGSTYESETDAGDISFNNVRLLSGTWYMLLFGVTTDGNLTGNYVLRKFTIAEETATPGFNKFLGVWSVTSGSYGFDLSISKIDANYMYKIEGWETWNGVDFNMSDTYIEGIFDKSSQKIIINSQWVGTATAQDNTTLDTYLFGNFEYKGDNIAKDLYFIADDVRIAEITLSADGRTAILNGVGINAEIHYDNGNSVENYQTVFKSMQYYDYYAPNDEYAMVNGSSIPDFPLNLSFKSALTSLQTGNAAIVNKTSRKYSRAAALSGTETGGASRSTERGRGSDLGNTESGSGPGLKGTGKIVGSSFRSTGGNGRGAALRSAGNDRSGDSVQRSGNDRSGGKVRKAGSVRSFRR